MTATAFKPRNLFLACPEATRQLVQRYIGRGINLQATQPVAKPSAMCRKLERWKASAQPASRFKYWLATSPKGALCDRKMFGVRLSVLERQVELGRLKLVSRGCGWKPSVYRKTQRRKAGTKGYE